MFLDGNKYTKVRGRGTPLMAGALSGQLGHRVRQATGVSGQRSLGIPLFSGVLAPGVAWLIGQSVVALVLAPRLWRQAVPARAVALTAEGKVSLR